MRISETKVAQLVEGPPNQLVLVDESTGDEIALNGSEVHGLVQAIAHFGAHL